MRYAGLLLMAAALQAHDLAPLARAYRSDPTPSTRAPLLKLAATREDPTSALAALVLGSKELELGQFDAAIEHLEAARKHLPILEDYPAYLAAAAYFANRGFGRVEHALKPVWDRHPPSPLVSKAVILLANNYLKENEPQRAKTLVERRMGDLKPAESAALLAHAAELLGDSNVALANYRLILREYPLSPQAADAESNPARLAAMPPKARLIRIQKLLDANAYAQARSELDSLPPLTGADRDSAGVKRAVVEYAAKSYAAALESLETLKVAAPEADAERLYYIVRCARRLDKPSAFQPALDRLAAAHPRSSWRLQALLAAGDYYFLQNNVPAYEPVYHACAESFAPDPRSADCQWRWAWAGYLRHRPVSPDLFKTLIARFPESDKVPNSLYFLGRIAESQSDAPAARAYYERIVAVYPNYFYATLARERLHALAAAPTPTAATESFLKTVPLPPAGSGGNFLPNAESRVRLDRARLLASAGLDDLAESELRFGARVDGQPEVAAIELAELANQRGEPQQGIRYIKQLAPNYLRIPIEAAPAKFWKLAFPLPFREPLERYSAERGLDPFLVAALIRQESEFNARIVSHAHAYGLTQVLPSTGREIGRKLSLTGFRPDMLFTPEINLRIGTYFLRSLLDRLEGRWEAALASYNAGPGRVAKWLAWGDFREPAEFVETIPFDETRNYVQSVLRNADLYRRLYGGGSVPAAPRK